MPVCIPVGGEGDDGHVRPERVDGGCLTVIKQSTRILDTGSGTYLSVERARVQEHIAPGSSVAYVSTGHRIAKA
eukprot:3940507-Rhodomonas_salina.5